MASAYNVNTVKKMKDNQEEVEKEEKKLDILVRCLTFIQISNQLI